MPLDKQMLHWELKQFSVDRFFFSSKLSSWNDFDNRRRKHTIQFLQECHNGRIQILVLLPPVVDSIASKHQLHKHHNYPMSFLSHGQSYPNHQLQEENFSNF